MEAVQVSELMDLLEFEQDETSSWVDLQTGKVVILPNELIEAVEDEGEEDLKRLPDWELEMLEIARAVVADSGARFVHPPDKFAFHEYRQMERFIHTVESKEAAEELWFVIKGSGAFRNFKRTATRFNLLDQWYQYRKEPMKQFVQDWAEANQVPLIDNTAQADPK